MLFDSLFSTLVCQAIQIGMVAGHKQTPQTVAVRLLSISEYIFLTSPIFRSSNTRGVIELIGNCILLDSVLFVAGLLRSASKTILCLALRSGLIDSKASSEFVSIIGITPLMWHYASKHQRDL